MANASRDENFVPTLLAASSADGVTPVKVYADPTTHRLLTVAEAGIVGPGSSTDNAVVRWDGTTGETLQDSLVIIGDTGAISGVTNILASGTISTVNVTASGFINAATFEVGNVTGATGTFTTVDLKTVTVVGGIITSIA